MGHAVDTVGGTSSTSLAEWPGAVVEAVAPESLPIVRTPHYGRWLAVGVVLILLAQFDYKNVLERWNLGCEAVATSELNPPGLPRTQ